MRLLRTTLVVLVSLAVLHGGAAWALLNCFRHTEHLHSSHSVAEHVDSTHHGSSHTHIAEKGKAESLPFEPTTIHCPEQTLLFSATIRPSISYQLKLLASWAQAKETILFGSRTTRNHSIQRILSPPGMGFQPLHLVNRILQI